MTERPRRTLAYSQRVLEDASPVNADDGGGKDYA